MLIVGIVLLILGWVLGISVLWIIGLILACVGAALWIGSGVTHRPIGGRRYY